MRRLILSIITVMVIAAPAFAATSSPCGYKEPAPQPREEGYRRDVLDFRVPVQTENKGTVYREQATRDRETLISGQE